MEQHMYFVIGNDPGHAARAAADMCACLSKGYDVISAVASDGTIHYVLKLTPGSNYDPCRT